MGDAAQIRNKVEEMHEQYNEQTNFQDGMGQDNQFPQPLYTTDPYSENLRLKQAILQQTGGRPQVAVTDKDVEYLKRLQAQQDRAKFNQFIANIFNYSDPANRDKFLKLFPEYAEIRKKLVANRAELEQKIASLMITGVQTKDDIMTLYALNMGHIEFPTTPLYDPNGYYSKSTAYKAGPFAPKYSNKRATKLRDLNDKLGFSQLNQFLNDATGDVAYPKMGLGGEGSGNAPGTDERYLVDWAGYGAQGAAGVFGLGE